MRTFRNRRNQVKNVAAQKTQNSNEKNNLGNLRQNKAQSQKNVPEHTEKEPRTDEIPA